MDKELYIKRRNMIKEITKTNITIKNLKLFLKENEEFFKNKESLEALKNIKTYLENIKQKEEKLREEYTQTQINMRANCNHEIILIDDYKNLECPICDLPVLKNETHNTELIIKVNITPQYYKEKISQELEQTPISLLEQKLKQEINENKIKILKRKYK